MRKKTYLCSRNQKLNKMSKEEIKNRLREIVNKSARTLTAADKDFLRRLGDELGIQKDGKSGCQKCWHDFAMTCWQRIVADEKENAPKLEETGRKYILKSGVDLIFGSIRVNETTLTDELAEKIIARGFEKKWFEKCE